MPRPISKAQQERKIQRFKDQLRARAADLQRRGVRTLYDAFMENLYSGGEGNCVFEDYDMLWYSDIVAMFHPDEGPAIPTSQVGGGPNKLNDRDDEADYDSYTSDLAKTLPVTAEVERALRDAKATIEELEENHREFLEEKKAAIEELEQILTPIIPEFVEATATPFDEEK